MPELLRSSTGSPKKASFQPEQSRRIGLTVCTKIKNVLFMSCLKDACKVALPSSCLAALLKVLDHNLQLDFLSQIMPDKIVYSSFTGIMGTLIVFRTVQALAQYRAGASLIYKMNGSWLDAASALISFTRHSKSQRTLVENFRHTAVRLFSLLNMLCLAELENNNHRASKQAVSFEVIDTSTLDLETLNSIRSSDSKVEIVGQLIQCMTVDGLAEGVLTVPAPMISRIFQNLDHGMTNYNSAKNVAHIAIPLPYVIVTEGLLAVHAIFTPLAMCTFNLGAVEAFLFTLLTVLVPWSFNFLATELGNPFGADANDLPVGELQYDLNERLHAILDIADHPMPTTHWSAVKSGSAAMVKATTTIHSEQEIKYTLDDFFARICNQADKSRALDTCRALACKQEVFEAEEDQEEKEEQQQEEFKVPALPRAYSNVSYAISEVAAPDEEDREGPVHAHNTTNYMTSQAASDVVDHEVPNHTAEGHLCNPAGNIAGSCKEKTNRSEVALDVVDHEVPAHADNTTNNITSQVASDVVDHEVPNHTLKGHLCNPAANTAGSCKEKTNRSEVALDVVDHEVPAHADNTTNNITLQEASDVVDHEVPTHRAKGELSNPAANTAGSRYEQMNRIDGPRVLAQVLGQDERLEHESAVPPCTNSEIHLPAELAGVHLETTCSAFDCPGTELPEFTTPASTPRAFT